MNGYLCFCGNAWEGRFCELDKNECNSNPCAHGGACEDAVGGYVCDCPNGYSGKCHNLYRFKNVLNVNTVAVGKIEREKFVARGFNGTSQWLVPSNNLAINLAEIYQLNHPMTLHSQIKSSTESE